jgi:hypothetical protein
MRLSRAYDWALSEKHLIQNLKTVLLILSIHCMLSFHIHLKLEICQAKHLILKKKNDLDFPLIADQSSREMVFHITVCSYKKLAIFTTNVDAEN